MAEQAAEVEYLLKARVEGVQQLNKSIKGIQGAFRSLKGPTSSLISTFTKLTAGYLSFQGAMRGTRFVVDTISSFESLEATLDTLLGGVDAAEAKFKDLRRIAVQTPFTVENVTKAFAQLSARGVEPTNEDIISVGNTAAAFGQDITSFANAVGQAIAGENERLKQFGISASVQGKKVSLTYKGVTQEVNRDIEGISQALLQFGKATGESPFGGKFAGAAEKQAERLGGAIGRLKDVLQLFAFDLGKGGLTKALVELVNTLRGFLATEEVMQGETIQLAKRLGQTLGNAVQRLNEKIKQLPAFLEKAQMSFEDFKKVLQDTLNIDNTTEAISRLGAAMTAIAAARATPKAIEFLSTIFKVITAGGTRTVLAGLGAGALALLKWLAILVLVFLVVDDIITFIQGGNSLIGRFFDSVEEAEDGPLGAIKELKDAFVGLIMDLAPLWRGLEFLIRGTLPEALGILRTVGEAILTSLGMVVEFWLQPLLTVIAVIRAIVALIRGDFSGAWDILKDRAAGFFGFLVDSLFDVLGLVSKLIGKFGLFFGAVNDVEEGMNKIRGEGGTLPSPTANSILDFLSGKEKGPPPVDLDKRTAAAVAGPGMVSMRDTGIAMASTNNVTINIKTIAQDPQAIGTQVTKALDEHQESRDRQAMGHVRAAFPEQ